MRFVRAGLELRGTAQATLEAAIADAGKALVVADEARLTMNGGAAAGKECDVEHQGIVASGAARVTLKGVGFADMAGGWLDLSGDASATLDQVDEDANLPIGCNPSNGVQVRDSASLTVLNSTIETDSRGTSLTHVPVGIDTNSDAPLLVRNTTIRGYKTAGIRAGANARSIEISDSKLAGTGIQVDAGAAPNAQVTVERSSLEGQATGIVAARLRLRGTRIRETIGVGITGPFVDLGQPGAPGGNDLAGNFRTGVECRLSTPCAIFATGNTWNPGIQAADQNGRYTGALLVDGFSPFAQGRNFMLGSNRLSAIQL